jgi:LacI family transcriptional regulator
VKSRRSTASSTPATIHDVAAAAGVSVATVSKSLNGTGQLRDATRKRVHQAAKRLEFRPNDLAQSLLRGRSYTVGLVSTDRYGRFSIPLLEGIEDALENARMSVFLCNGADEPLRERRHVEQLLAKRVDGIIVTARRTDPRPALDVPRSLPLLYAFAQARDAGAMCLLPDDRGGGRLATRHLVRAGRRRIAHITGPGDFEAVRGRCDGYRDALREANLPEPRGAVLSGPWSEAWGREAVDILLQRGRAIDAIFCGSDQIARGTIDALRDRGIRVPDDVAVVGFDNWSVVAAATRPPLTTVDMNLHELGRQAGLLLLDMIDGRAQRGIVRLPCHLVRRESCGAVAHRASHLAEDRASPAP